MRASVKKEIEDMALNYSIDASKGKVNWYLISRYQTLSEDFIKELKIKSVEDFIRDIKLLYPKMNLT